MPFGLRIELQRKLALSKTTEIIFDCNLLCFILWPLITLEKWAGILLMVSFYVKVYLTQS